MKSEVSLSAMLEQLNTPERIGSVRGLRRGIEREGLRITPEGRLSQKPHPKVLGAALTHPNITTDYAESLIEFITPPSDSMETLLSQLGDIHRYTVQHLGEERLWPLSMPCFIGGEESIGLAQYGSSNIGKLKTLYREGLHHRYGSLMQVIAGVHYNFSMPDSFWSEWQDLRGVRCQCKRFISDGYMGLIRNVYRFGWLIPYLFGASPALCSSFLQGKESRLPFEKLGRGTLYLPYATSLRLSDLGYTNKAQAALNINHDTLDNYLMSVRRALRTRSEEFASLGVKVEGNYRQLNDHVLQLENELYAPIRPKRSPRDGERTLSALEHRGIEYIELRTLDLNPFSPLGVDLSQLRFLDIFLVWCLLKPSAPLSSEEIVRNRQNLTRVVLEGRRPDVMLHNGSGEVTLRSWGEQLFEELSQVAQLLDRAYGRVLYQVTLQGELEKIKDPTQTLSARVLDHLLKLDMDSATYGRELAEKYRQQLRGEELMFWDGAYFADEAHASIAKQREIEAMDHQSFDDFLKSYLSH